MTIKEIDKIQAEKLLNNYFLNRENYTFNLPLEYAKIREELVRMYNESLILKSNTKKIDEYDTDLSFAFKIYKYFNSFDWFDESVASNYKFWAYICVCVIPDIIERRHGAQIEYFYEKNVRMYVPTMWWYIHMSYQGNDQDTLNCLRNLSTDYIMQLVERPGRDGLYLSVSRKIMNYIGKIDKKSL